jgi:hypothetical protein
LWWWRRKTSERREWISRLREVYLHTFIDPRIDAFAMTKEWGTTMNLFPAGYTTPSVDVEVTDDSGLPVTGLNASTFPTLKYSIAGANNSATLTLSDLTNENSAFTAQGVKERGEGVYRIDLPLAAVATVGSVVKLRGTASGKRVFCAPIVVMDMISAGF